MKALSDQDHYEILETHRDAAQEEIERCYRMCMATYADDSLAGYSVFGEGDAEALRERIEVAFRVLSDRELRRDYDASLGVAPIPIEEATLAAVIAAEAPLQPEPPIVHEPLQPQVGEFEQLDDGSGEFDGARLRRYRMRCGLELEDIAGVTKINPTYLRYIEDERHADLPAQVYVRGFVTAYASSLGLDAKHVAASYMRRYEQGRGAPRKSRFFEGR